ncbi:MAG TPA: YceI family protein [Vicinamibacterales bacterium]|nr:YceI family protein [Vicinamibacterales bacterium]
MASKKITSTCTTIFVGLCLLPLPARAQDAADGQTKLRVRNAQVSVLCPLTIGGSFEAKTKALSGQVGMAPDASQPLDGDLLVDLQTLETGIGLRDDHLRRKYLEVERGPTFAQARLRNIRVEKLAGKTPFRATLLLHGQTRDVTGTADIKPEGDGYRLNASFPVRVSEFGIPEPTYLGVGVKDEVVVRVNLNAEPAAVATSGRSK